MSTANLRADAQNIKPARPRNCGAFLDDEYLVAVAGQIASIYRRAGVSPPGRNVALMAEQITNDVTSALGYGV